VVAVESSALTKVSGMREFRIGISCALAIELLTLFFVILHFHRSWHDDAIGIGVLTLALLIPFMFALNKLYDLPVSSPSAVLPRKLLIAGFLVGMAVSLMTLSVDDHAAGTTLLMGLLVQAVLQSMAVRRLQRAQG
jgi:hypothetical protein